MSVSTGRHRAIALIVCVMMGAPALAAQKASNAPLLPGSNSKEPISIDADKLEYFDKEQKAIYTGNVVAIQGDSKLTCSVMTFSWPRPTPQPAAPPPPNRAPPAAADVRPPVLRQPPAAILAAGEARSNIWMRQGRSLLSRRRRSRPGDRGAYDKDQNKVWLFGNVTLSDSGGNVTKGDKLTYDLTAGTAVVEVDQGGADKTHKRVQSQFIPARTIPRPPMPTMRRRSLPTPSRRRKLPRNRRRPPTSSGAEGRGVFTRQRRLKRRGARPACQGNLSFERRSYFP